GDEARVVTVRVVDVAEAAGDVAEADARQECDTVPLAIAVVNGLVPQSRERELRKRVVGELRLLEAQDVGFSLREPFLDARQPRLQRVHVPRRHSHVGAGYASTTYISRSSLLGGIPASRPLLAGRAHSARRSAPPSPRFARRAVRAIGVPLRSCFPLPSGGVRGAGRV